MSDGLNSSGIEVGSVPSERAAAGWAHAIQVSEADRAWFASARLGQKSRGGARHGAGRPADSAAGAKMQLSTRLDPAAVVRLHELAQQTGMSKAELLERMILGYVP